jgi:hypothetical protein
MKRLVALGAKAAITSGLLEVCGTSLRELSGPPLNHGVPAHSRKLSALSVSEHAVVELGQQATLAVLLDRLAH